MGQIAMVPHSRCSVAVGRDVAASARALRLRPRLMLVLHFISSSVVAAADGQVQLVNPEGMMWVVTTQLNHGLWSSRRCGARSGRSAAGASSP
jgi:hypothetical protein